MGKNYKPLITKLKKINPSNLDNYFHNLHKGFFDKFDCLSCAKCCKELGPRISMTDISRISKYLKLKTSQFIDKFLNIDDDGDYVFKSMPCPFLGKDNLCDIYEVRPKACKEYPHTNRKNMKGILDLTLKNADYCPTVEYILNEFYKMQQNSKLK